MKQPRRLAVPTDVKQRADAIVDAFNRNVFRDPHKSYRARYDGRYLYLDRLDYGIQKFVCRLTYTGSMDNWEFAIYKYSDEGYDPDERLFPGAGHVDGTIEGAMKAGLEAYP